MKYQGNTFIIDGGHNSMLIKNLRTLQENGNMNELSIGGHVVLKNNVAKWITITLKDIEFKKTKE